MARLLTLLEQQAEVGRKKMATVVTSVVAEAVATAPESNGTKATPPLHIKSLPDASTVAVPGDAGPPPYYLEHGLRRVAPYYYTYNTWCKERWRGRELIDIFSSEFRDRPV